MGLLGIASLELHQSPYLAILQDFALGIYSRTGRRVEEPRVKLFKTNWKVPAAIQELSRDAYRLLSWAYRILNRTLDRSLTEWQYFPREFRLQFSRRYRENELH